MRSNLSCALYVGLESPPNSHISRLGASPCTRSSGTNVPNWNQRVFSSRHSSRSSALGCAVEKRSGTEKPPMSIDQYGTPETDRPSPAGICERSAVQVDEMSPDQTAAP